MGMDPIAIGNQVGKGRQRTYQSRHGIDGYEPCGPVLRRNVVTEAEGAQNFGQGFLSAGERFLTRPSGCKLDTRETIKNANYPIKRPYRHFTARTTTQSRCLADFVEILPRPSFTQMIDHD